jgi:hypothetical protein
MAMQWSVAQFVTNQEDLLPFRPPHRLQCIKVARAEIGQLTAAMQLSTHNSIHEFQHARFKLQQQPYKELKYVMERYHSPSSSTRITHDSSDR